MEFVKFDADDDNYDEVKKEFTKKKAKPVKRKRRADSHEECEEPKRMGTWTQTQRRKAKEIDFRDCKNDLKHLFYVNHIAQKNIPHTLVPEFNAEKNALDDLLDLPKNIYPHCCVAAPRPIYYAKKHCDNSDVCFARTISLEHYKKRLGFSRTSYLNKWKNNRQIRKLAQDSVYHNSLYTLAERLERNPDPFFYGNYDFYFTGGNLCALPDAKTHNLLHVDSNEIGSLKLSTYPLHEDASLATLQECTSLQLPTDADIFEISLLNAENREQDLAAVRQLNNITILAVDRTKNSMKVMVDFQTKHVPLISFAQSLEKPSMLVVTNMKQNIRVYDISRPKSAKLKSLYKMQTDSSNVMISCWNRIKHWQGETFLYANEHQLMFADLRAPQVDWLKTECTFSSNEFPCEFNTSLALSKFDQLFYVGTTHKLRCLDARYLTQQTHYEHGSVCEWSHQMDYPPALLDVHRDLDREFVACASQLAGDLRICELTQSKRLKRTEACDFESHCLPWQPPTLQEAYDSATIAGKILQPEAGLKQRIRACTTGLGFFNLGTHNKTQTLLLSATSVGDVYAQAMTRRENATADQRTTPQTDDLMGEFAQNLCKLKQPTLNCTDMADMKVMRSVFLSSRLNRVIVKQETDPTEPQANIKDSKFKRHRGRWPKSMATLHSYKDALVPDLLSIWDIPIEDETDIKYSALAKRYKEEKSDKDVLNWLSRNDRIAPTTVIPLSNLNMCSMDVEASGFEPQAQSTQILPTERFEITFLNSEAVIAESTFNNTTRTIVSKPKASKAKKKHVKGF